MTFTPPNTPTVSIAALDAFLAFEWSKASDPEPVAAEVWAWGFKVRDTQAAIRRCVKAGTIKVDHMSEWEGDVVSAVRWAVKHRRSPMSTSV